MAEYLGSDYIYNTLLNNTDVAALVSTRIYSASVIPQSVVGMDTINSYRVGDFDASMEYFQNRISVNCRSKAEPTSLSIGIAVVEALNRASAVYNGYTYFVTCEVLPTIPPQNEEDVYNTPVECRVRRR